VCLQLYDESFNIFSVKTNFQMICQNRRRRVVYLQMIRRRRGTKLARSFVCGVDGTPSRWHNQEKLLPVWISVVETLLRYGAALILKPCSSVCPMYKHTRISVYLNFYTYMFIVYLNRELQTNGRKFKQTFHIYTCKIIRATIQLCKMSFNCATTFTTYVGKFFNHVQSRFHIDLC